MAEPSGKSFQEAVGSLWEALTERFANPFLRAFLIGWLIFNVKFLMIVFSTEDMLNRLSAKAG